MIDRGSKLHVANNILLEYRHRQQIYCHLNENRKTMTCLTVSPKRKRDCTKNKFKVMGNHERFLSRIKKTLYYGKLPLTERFSLPVSELAAEWFSKVKSGKSLERLDLEEAAAFSRNACVSPCSLVLALLYLERLKTCNPEYLQRVAPSELFLVSMMIASKFLHDDGEPDEVFNDEWAASAGLAVDDVNRFERDFLQAIEWEVFISEKAFWKRLLEIEKEVALREGKRRGWFSYTELENLLDTVDLSALVQILATVSAVCLTSYTASVLTLIGSAFIVSQIPGTSISSTFTTSHSFHPQEPILVTNSVHFAPANDLSETAFAPTSCVNDCSHACNDYSSKLDVLTKDKNLENSSVSVMCKQEIHSDWKELLSSISTRYIGWYLWQADPRQLTHLIEVSNTSWSDEAHGWLYRKSLQYVSFPLETTSNY